MNICFETESAAIEKAMPSLDLTERLRWLLDHYPGQIGMTTAFGYTGVIMMYHLKDLGIDFPVYFIDTGFHFPETIRLRDEVATAWGVDIQTIRTSRSDAELAAMIGENAPQENPDACCGARKLEPMDRVLPTKPIWLHGLRWDQSPTRANLTFTAGGRQNTLKVHPLLDWTREQCWDFIRANDLKYNQLHDRGYPSIGCTHCTRAVAKGEDERAGRWSHTPEKMECGLHYSAELKAKAEAVAKKVK